MPTVGLGRAGATIFVIAVLVNYPWELAQMPLYAVPQTVANPWWHCLIASLGDGALVILIYFAGSWILGRPDWIERPRPSGYAFMVGFALLIAIAIEWAALSTGRWSYTAAMPQFPALGVGVVPVVQMLLLPPVIFAVASRWLRHRGTS